MHPGADDLRGMPAAALAFLIIIDIFFTGTTGGSHFSCLQSLFGSQALLEAQPAVGKGHRTRQQPLAQNLNGEIEHHACFGSGADNAFQLCAKLANGSRQLLLRLKHIQRQRFQIALGETRHSARLAILIVDLAFQPPDQHIADHLALFVREIRRLGKAHRI